MIFRHEILIYFEEQLSLMVTADKPKFLNFLNGNNPIIIVFYFFIKISNLRIYDDLLYFFYKL